VFGNILLCCFLVLALNHNDLSPWKHYDWFYCFLKFWVNFLWRFIYKNSLRLGWRWFSEERVCVFFFQTSEGPLYIFMLVFFLDDTGSANLSPESGKRVKLWLQMLIRFSSCLFIVRVKIDKHPRHLFLWLYLSACVAVTKCYRLGGLNNTFIFLQFWRLGNPRSKCQQNQFLGRAFPLVYRWLLFCYALTGPFLGAYAWWES